MTAGAGGSLASADVFFSEPLPTLRFVLPKRSPQLPLTASTTVPIDVITDKRQACDPFEISGAKALAPTARLLGAFASFAGRIRLALSTTCWRRTSWTGGQAGPPSP